MAQFNLSPHWIDFRYTTDGEQHVQKFQVQSPESVPVANPNSIVLIAKDSSNVTLQQFAGDWTDVLSAYFDGTQCTFDSMTLWYQPDLNPEPIFIGAADTSTGGLWNQPIGTGGTKRGAQETQTYRCTNGKILKITLMETVSAPHYRVSLASVTNPAFTPLIDYMLSPACVPQARSGAFPLLGMNRTGVFNDKLVRERFNVD